MSRSPLRCDRRMQAWHIPPASMWLAQAGLPQTRQVVAVGDWLNDVPMFQWAGHAFAMAQAPAEVKSAATCVLDAHTEAGGGIAEAARRVGWLG